MQNGSVNFMTVISLNNLKFTVFLISLAGSLPDWLSPTISSNVMVRPQWNRGSL